MSTRNLIRRDTTERSTEADGEKEGEKPHSVASARDSELDPVGDPGGLDLVLVLLDDVGRKVSLEEILNRTQDRGSLSFAFASTLLSRSLLVAIQSLLELVGEEVGAGHLARLLEELIDGGLDPILVGRELVQLVHDCGEGMNALGIDLVGLGEGEARVHDLPMKRVRMREGEEEKEEKEQEEFRRKQREVIIKKNENKLFSCWNAGGRRKPATKEDELRK